MSPESQNAHPAILEMPYHKFIPSEFAPESGRCDICGGGEGAEEHQKPVDQMARIADALERIADRLDDIADVAQSVVGSDDDSRSLNIREWK
jgi:hypothetical protein